MDPSLEEPRSVPIKERLLQSPPDPSTRRLLDPSFLFRFSVPFLHTELAWTDLGIKLPDAYRLPCFGELDGGPLFADVRGAWNRDGIYFNVRVADKKQAPWCRETRADESDGFHVWIDTRDTHNVHRASRFCHRFVFLPMGSGRMLNEPTADQLLIHRARENAKPIRPDDLRVRSEKRVDGYILACCIPAPALPGYEPVDHPKLGFTYAVTDRELGWQTFSVGSEFRFQEDPSLWGTLELQS